MAPLAEAFVRVRPVTTGMKEQVVRDIQAAGPAAEKAATDVGKRVGGALAQSSQAQAAAVMSRAARASSSAGSRSGSFAGTVGGSAAGYAIGNLLQNALPSRLQNVLAAGSTGALVGSAFGPIGAGVGAAVGGGVALGAGLQTHIDSKDALAHMTAVAAASTEGRQQVEALAAGLDKASRAGNFGGEATKLRGVAQAALSAAHQMTYLTTTSHDAAHGLVTQTEVMERLARNAVSLRSAQDGLRQAVRDAAQAVADGDRTLRGNSDTALVNRDALRGEAAAVLAIVDAMRQRGASDAATQATMAALTQVVETQATKLYGDKAAVDALLASLGLVPTKAANAASALAALDAATAAKTELPGRDVKSSLIGNTERQVEAAKKAAAAISKAFTTGYTPAVSKEAKKAAKAVSDAMRRAEDQVQSDLQKLRDAVSSTQQTLAGFAAFSTSGTDSLGASGTNSDFTAQKREKAAQLEQFANLYGRLVKAGLNPDDLHEFVGLGPAAIPAMQALLSAGRAGIRQENALDRRINKASLTVARQDTADQNARLIHKDLTLLPHKFARQFAVELAKLRIVTDAKALDRRNGLAVVTAP